MNKGWSTHFIFIYYFSSISDIFFRKSVLFYSTSPSPSHSLQFLPFSSHLKVHAIWINKKQEQKRSTKKVCGALWNIYVSEEMEIYLNEKLQQREREWGKRTKNSEGWFEDAIIYVLCGSTSKVKRIVKVERKGIKIFDVQFRW